MTSDADVPRVVRATRDVAASAEVIFELIADPSHQPLWDGNDNLAEAPEGQRIREVGEMFTMVLTGGNVRENHVVEFEEARRIAWRPADPGQPPAGHLWRWELEPKGPSLTQVTHSYDWSQLTDENRFDRARATTSEMLRASLDRLAHTAESRMDAARPKWGQVVLDTTNARDAAEFWRQLLGLVYRPGHEPPPDGQDDPAGRDWLNLREADGTPLLAFQQVSALTPTTWPDHAVPQQLHLDLTVDTVAELDEVHARVLALGGTLRLDRSDDPEEPLRVYADPDGHTFCVFVA